MSFIAAKCTQCGVKHKYEGKEAIKKSCKTHTIASNIFGCCVILCPFSLIFTFLFQWYFAIVITIFSAIIGCFAYYVAIATKEAPEHLKAAQDKEKENNGEIKSCNLRISTYNAIIKNYENNIKEINEKTSGN